MSGVRRKHRGAVDQFLAGGQRTLVWYYQVGHSLH
jgi:hypothetical protein